VPKAKKKKENTKTCVCFVCLPQVIRTANGFFFHDSQEHVDQVSLSY